MRTVLHFSCPLSSAEVHVRSVIQFLLSDKTGGWCGVRLLEPVHWKVWQLCFSLPSFACHCHNVSLAYLLTWMSLAALPDILCQHGMSCPQDNNCLSHQSQEILDIVEQDWQLFTERVKPSDHIQDRLNHTLWTTLLQRAVDKAEECGGVTMHGCLNRNTSLSWISSVVDHLTGFADEFQGQVCEATG